MKIHPKEMHMRTTATTIMGTLIIGCLMATGCFTEGNIRTITFKDGSKYVGEFKDDIKQGYGRMTWANGDQYEGQWVNDAINGKGVFTWANGDRYDGQWAANKRSGQGFMVEKTVRSMTASGLITSAMARER